ncbi:fibronectin type III and SPRY domain-containing protein 2 [Microcaecilia unicolor]|uniref:Fibronectin type III and SPRY domain-containing protein 2 n=1 Tax=Microcaecilia unicolor TaxID=1415580 RepID=A0A6P7X4H3_9AMPH|nr:fibronectin type III and SPRY domain-containing protein 2 [Microcaecilia unicolor]
MSSSPTATTETETTSNNPDKVSAGDLDQSKDETTSGLDEDPEGLKFYHMDLYESKERLDIFPDVQVTEKKGHGVTAEVPEQSGEKDQLEYSSQKEIDELARLYGLEEDKEIVEDFRVEQTPLPGVSDKGETFIQKYNVEHKKIKPQQSVENREQEYGTKIFQDTMQEHDDVSSNSHFDEEAVNNATNRENQRIDTDSKLDKNDSTQSEPTTQHQKEEIADIYCVTCETPIRAFEKLFGIHKEHEVTELSNVIQDVKEEIHNNMCKLEEQIAQLENLAIHLEEIFISVEENVVRQEQNFEIRYNEVMQALTQRYEEKLQTLGEEKREKLESLYDQLVASGKKLDSSRELMESIQELLKSKEKVEFIKTAVNTADRVEEFFKTDTELEISINPEYENKTIDFSDVQQLMDSISAVPAPSAPIVNPQSPNSATGTSVRVCWSPFSEDTVECYQLYYKPVSDDPPTEQQTEFMMKVKETYCTVYNLILNTQYEFWVTALNTTGISPASERAVYVTAPSPPIIKPKDCRSCETAALVRWESGNMNPVDSYTVELCKVSTEDHESDITESIVGIPTCESLIQLDPREKYHIYVRAVNVGGVSERSKPITIHTTGTFFHLNEETAHPLLSILEDGFTIACQEEESLLDFSYHYNSFTRCIAVMGNLIPVKGKHYWEVDTDENVEYRIGVAFEDTNRNGVFGTNNTSWCMRHIVTPSRHKYEFLHCGSTPDVWITIPPRKIGILLDYEKWKLSFFNMDLLQHLYTFSCHFQHLVHPIFALEKPGVLRIRNGVGVPKCLSFF